MAVRLTKPWMSIADALARLHGHLGVFELGDGDDNVIFIGFAGAKSQFGLRAEVAATAESVAGAVSVRFEITSAYHSRFRELLMAHIADFGALPAGNPPELLNEITLGRLSPA